MNANNNLSAQLNAMSATNAQCCCQTQNLITTGFADLNYNLATQECNTRQAVANASREIIDNDNANYRALNDRLTQMEMNAKDEKIASLNNQIRLLTLHSLRLIRTIILLDSFAQHLSQLIRWLTLMLEITIIVVVTDRRCLHDCTK